MEVIHKFLNVAAPIFTFITFCFFLPPFYFFKFVQSIFGAVFHEDVSGKVVLITGASSGIGEHVAYEYGKRGAYLALAARRKNKLQEVADRARDLGSPDVLTITADVAKVEDCKRIVDETISNFGRLDHLVCNAGINSVCMFEEKKNITDFRVVMDINFWGSVYATRFAVPHLKESKGKIVALSSSAAWLPAARMSIYNASKAALLSFYETLRVELGSDISITIVTPGYIESELTQGQFLSGEGRMEVDQEMRDVQVNAVPVGSASGCAEAIVNSACRGDRYLTEPAWFKVTYLWKVFWPEMVEWNFRLTQMAGISGQDALGKKILDYTGARNILYPSSVRTPELKAD